MKIAFLLYPPSKIKPSENTSFWMMRELQKRSHEVFYFESHELVYEKNSPRARLRKARLDVRKGVLPAQPSQRFIPLTDMAAVVIRKEPPFDTEYLYCLQLLELIKNKTFVLNDPTGIAMANEKLLTLEFPDWIPESFVTRDISAARKFIQTLGTKVVVKRLDEKGGAGIFSTQPSDENLVSLLESATRLEKERVLIQRFVSASRYGDKRILLLNGEIIGAFVRRPPSHDFRANIALGGSFHRTRLNGRDRKIVNAIAPRLAEGGLYFTGIDVIGRFLTEINVTSPSGVADVIALERKHPETKIADFIEERA